MNVKGVPSFFYSLDPVPTKVIPIKSGEGRDGRINWNLVVSAPEKSETASANSQEPYLAPYDDNEGDMLDCMDMEESYEILPTRSGKFITSFYVPPPLQAIIVGAKGKTLRELQDNTQTMIKVPRPNEPGDVKITGHSERSVASARNQVNMLLLGKRERLDITHFVSVPMVSEEIKCNFEKFKKEILDQPSTRGIEESIFQNPKKLHLTIVALTLLDESEVEAAKSALQDFHSNIIRSLFLPNKKYSINISGVEIMNDDSSEVDVLYGKVKLTENSENFQLMCNEIQNLFSQKGLVLKHYDNVKLHVTLMNSLFRKSNESEGPSKRRSTFDASFIMEKYKNFNFGSTIFKNVDLSIKSSVGKNGFYDFALSIPIC